jgi:hypothetical protein
LICIFIKRARSVWVHVFRFIVYFISLELGSATASLFTHIPVFYRKVVLSRSLAWEWTGTGVFPAMLACLEDSRLSEDLCYTFCFQCWNFSIISRVCFVLCFEWRNFEAWMPCSIYWTRWLAWWHYLIMNTILCFFVTASTFRF